MAIVLDGTAGITTPDVDSGPVSGTNFSYTGTLTGGTGVVNLGSGQFYKDASGNVGIGTSLPGSLLQIGGSLPVKINQEITTAPTNDLSCVIASAGSALTGAAGDLLLAPRSSQGRSILFYTGAGTTAERMRIDSSGNLLVGCTSAVSASVPGISTNIVVNDYAILSIGNTRTTSQKTMRFFNGNGEVGSISTNASATTYTTSSDYRLKHDIQPMTGALAKVQTLKPVTYKWNADDSDGEGFIAHELQEVCPSAVTGEKDAVDAEGNPVYQGIDTSFVVPLLTAALQEAVAKIESLTARIEALENQT